MTNKSFWIRLFISGAAFMLIAGRAQGQGETTVISFDALPRAAKPAAAPAPAKAPAKAAASSSRLSALGSRLTDTVRVVTVDTVRVLRVDTVRVAPTPTSTPAPAPKAAPVSFAPTNVNGLLQFMLSGGDSIYKSTYRVRRAEVKVVTDLGHKSSATVMVDLSKALSLSTSGTTTSVTQSSRVLQDAYFTLPVGRVTLDAGQQRLPLGLEGAYGSSALETVDRALMESDKARGASFGDVRDLGVTAKGTYHSVEYRAGLYNGSGEGMNETDKNVGKSAVGQLIWKPKFVKGFRFAMSGATSGKAAGDKPTRDRVGGDVQFSRGRLLLQSEAMAGRDGAVVRNGMYALGAWYLVPSLKVTARFDAWDPNAKVEAASADVTERDYLAGFTWFPPATRLKVQLAVVRKTYTHDITPAATLALTQIQAAW